MRLEPVRVRSQPHDCPVAGAQWIGEDAWITLADDGVVCTWVEGTSTQLITLQCAPTAAAVAPGAAPAAGAGSAARTCLIAVGASDGTLRLLQSNGREEKCVKATNGAAVTSVAWASDGGALVSTGEDGSVKVCVNGVSRGIAPRLAHSWLAYPTTACVAFLPAALNSQIWSRSLMLRSTLATAETPVYTAAWGPDRDTLLWACENKVTLSSASGDKRPIAWKAGDGTVLAAAWCAVTGRIITAGEDRKYRVWDATGRALFVSAAMPYPITAVAWNAAGTAFAVAYYNTVRIADSGGFAQARLSHDGGSLYTLAWGADGMQLLGAGGTGQVLRASLLGTMVSWGAVTAEHVEPARVTITDAAAELTEDLDFRDPVARMSLGCGHLVVATATQCHIYSAPNWSTPHIVDVKAPPTVVIQAPKCFAMVDAANGITVYSYEGRILCAPKFAGLRPEALSARTLSLASDALAVVDSTDPKLVRLFATRTGRPLGSPIRMADAVTDVALSHAGKAMPARRLAIIDVNRDLWLTPVMNEELVKLASMVDSVAWNETCDALAALCDDALVTWSDANAYFVDTDLAEAGRVRDSTTSLGRLPRIRAFEGARVTVQSGDGAFILVTVSPFLPALAQHTAANAWPAALRLARFVNKRPLWAALASQAIAAGALQVAEEAAAALEDAAKVAFLAAVREIPSQAGREAELALFRRAPPEQAESILLSAKPPLVFQAIAMNLQLFRWESALQLAKSTGRRHVNYVVAHRLRSLQASGRDEYLEAFHELGEAGHDADWGDAQALEQEELAAEAQRARAAGGAAMSPTGGHVDDAFLAESKGL